MDTVIARVAAIDLGGGDEMALIRGKARLETYDKLQGVQDITQWIQPQNHIALLIPTGTSFGNGHWIAVFTDPATRTLHHFDSYGLGPEGELKYVKNPLVLQRLLGNLYMKAQQSGWNLQINRTEFQQWGNNINTCGRHVICRIRLSYLNDEQYARLLTNQRISPDQIVTYLTFLALNDDEKDMGQIKSVV